MGFLSGTKMPSAFSVPENQPGEWRDVLSAGQVARVVDSAP